MTDDCLSAFSSLILLLVCQDTQLQILNDLSTPLELDAKETTLLITDVSNFAYSEPIAPTKLKDDVNQRRPYICPLTQSVSTSGVSPLLPETSLYRCIFDSRLTVKLEF